MEYVKIYLGGALLKHVSTCNSILFFVAFDFFFKALKFFFVKIQFGQHDDTFKF